MRELPPTWHIFDYDEARQYDRRFFTRDIQPNVYSIVESNNIDKDLINYFIDGREDLKSALHTILKEMKDAREFGAILNISEVNFEALNDRIDEIENEKELSFFRYQVHDVLIPFDQCSRDNVEKISCSGYKSSLYEFYIYAGKN